MKLPDEIYRYLKYLKGALGHSYDVYVAGGYLRDMLHGNGNPKDIDIVLIPKEEGHELIIQDSDWFVAITTLNCEYMEDMIERGACSLVMGFCPVMCKESQLIVYGKHLTALELAADFDFSVNQVVMSPEGVITCTELFTKDHKDKLLRQTKTYRAERMAERLERMKMRLPDYKETL